MTIAEIHGKISSTGRNLHDQLEDLLTSDVFTACKYLRPSTLLLPFLSTATSLRDTSVKELLPKDAVQADFHFWPRLAHGEPDLVIVIKDLDENIHLVVVEAKYLSGKSSVAHGEEELDTAAAPSDQLAGEYEDLLTLDNQLALMTDRIRSRLLVYVTAHRSIPSDSIKESMTEIGLRHPSLPAGPVFWTNWFALVPLLTVRHASEEWEIPIIEDLCDLMMRKGFIAYGGFDFIEPTTIVEGVAFYSVKGAKFGGSYAWAVPCPESASWYGSYYTSGTRQYYQGVMTPPIIGTIYRTGAGK